MVKITETDPRKGRHHGQASRQPTAAGQFGGAIEQPSEIRSAPSGAFGDSSGTAALANSMANVGNNFFDIAKRQDAMIAAEENARIERMQFELSHKEEEVRETLRKEAMENPHLQVPSNKFEEYRKRMDFAEQEIRGDFEFRTYTKDAINQRFKDIKNIAGHKYLNGEIEAERLNIIATDKQKTLQYHMDQAARKGSKLDTNGLAEILGNIKTLTSNFEYIAAVHKGDRAAAQAAGTTFAGKAVKAFLQEAAETNPNDARKLLDDAEGFLAQWMDGEELGFMREALQDVIKAEETEQREAHDRWQRGNYYELSMLYEVGQREPDARKLTKYDGYSAHKDGRINDQQLEAFMNKIDADTAKATAAQKKASWVQERLRQGASFHGTGKEFQDDIDAYWREIVGPSLQGLSTEKQSYFILDTIRQLGRLPRDVKLDLNGIVNAKDQRIAQVKADQIMTLANEIPTIQDDFYENTMRFAALYSADMTIDEAQARVEAVAGMTEQRRELYEEQTELLLGGKRGDEPLVVGIVEDWVEREFDLEIIGDTGDTTIPLGLLADYKTIFKENFMFMGDKNVDKVHELTQTMLKRKWARSRADGQDRMVKFAPEVEYQMTSEELEEQFRSEMSDEFNKKHAAGTFSLIPVPGKVGRNKKPTYFIQIINDRGQLDFMRDDTDGSYAQWYPDKLAYDEMTRKKLQKKLTDEQKRDKWLKRKMEDHEPFLPGQGPWMLQNPNEE